MGDYASWDQAGPEIEDRGSEPKLYQTPLERYTALRIRAARGERLNIEDAAFIRDFEVDFAEQYDLVREDIERRVRLAVVE